MAQNKLFDDITPAIKQALQLRKKKLIDRNMDEFSKTSYVRAVPVLLPELTVARQQIEPDITLEDMLASYTLGIQREDIPTPIRSYGKKYNRPDAGITELSVEQQGFSGKGLVKIQIKGVINTLEQIDFLKPILLTPGRYWLFEWGYTPARMIDLNKFFSKNANEKFDMCEKHRKETQGNGEAQIAVVDGYEYSMLESGAFSFDVSLIGSSTLFKRFTPSTEGLGFTEVPINPPTEFDKDGKKVNPGGIDLEGAISDYAQGLGVKTEYLTQKNPFKPNFAGIIESTTEDLGIQPAFTAATPKNFFEKLKEYILDTASLGQSSTFKDNIRKKAQEEIFKKAKIDNPQYRNYSSFDSIRKYGVYYDGNLKAEKIGNGNFDFNEFNNEIGPYVTWGWMEDNILSVVYGNNESDDTPMKIESTDENGVPLTLNSHKFLYTSRPDLLIIPGRMPTELETRFDNGKTTTLSKKSEAAASIARFGASTTNEQELNFDEAFLSYHPIVRKYLGISENALGFDEYSPFLPVSKSALYDKREDNVSTQENKIGSIRRLVLHYSMIKESFLNASTAQEGLLNLFKKVEGLGYTGFWNFGIFEVDNKIGCYERNSLTETGRKALEIAKDAVIDSSLQTNTPPPGVPFVFPTFNNDGGFVLQQNLTVKMPTGNMLAMVYGNTLEGRQQILNKALTSDKDGLEDFTALSNDDSTPPEKIKVRPGFQSGNIAIITSINLLGKKQFARIAPENVIKKTYKNIARKGKKDKGIKQNVVGREAVKVVEAFDKGLAYDANGIMYLEFQRNMNFKLQKKFMEENGMIVEVTGNNSQVLDMVELRLKILGIAGLDWGDMFHTDYIEERYKKETLFYVTKIEHQVTENKWTTDIIGGMRAIFNTKRTKSPRTLSKLEKDFIDIQLNQADKDLLEKLGKQNERVLVSIDNRFVYEEEDVNQTDTTNQ